MSEDRAGIDAARQQVAHASRTLAARGLVLGTAGNVSTRVGDQIAITPTGIRLAEVQADDVTVINPDGEVLLGRLEPTSELDLHLGVYARYDTHAVIHTHAPMATALSTVIDELPCVHYQMLMLGGTVRVAPYHTFGSPELAAATLEALEGRTAAIMANHGSIVHAHDLDHAVDACELLEWACTLYWRAAALGQPSTLDEAARAEVINAVIARSYGSTREVAG